MEFVFTAIYDYFKKHRIVYWCCFVFLFLLFGFGAMQIKPEADIQKMLPKDERIQTMSAIADNAGGNNQIIVTFSFKDTTYTNPDSLIYYNQQFLTKLYKEHHLYLSDTSLQKNSISDNVQQLVLENLPLFLDTSDYQKIDNLLQQDSLNRYFAQQKKMMQSPLGMLAGKYFRKDPLGLSRLGLQKIGNANSHSAFQMYDGYVFSKDEKNLTSFVPLKYPGTETGKNKIFFQHLDKDIETFTKSNPAVAIQYFGAAAVAAENAATIHYDTILTLSITIVFLLLINWYVFRKKRVTLLLLLPVLFGLLFALSIVWLIKGSISLIALGAGSIIMGIAVDFSIHFFSHARTHKNARENIASLSLPLTLGACTTIGAFIILSFANAPLLQDLGLLASTGLAGAAIFTLIFLPQIYSVQNQKVKETPSKENIIDKLANLKPEKSKWLLITVFLLTPVLWYYSGKVEFDGDLMQLNYISDKLKTAENHLNQHNDYAMRNIFIVAKGNTEDEATNKLIQLNPYLDSLKNKNLIKTINNPALILATKKEQENKIKKWQQYWTPEKIVNTNQLIRNAALHNQINPQLLSSFSQTLEKNYSVFNEKDKSLLQKALQEFKPNEAQSNLRIATLKTEPQYRNAAIDALSAIPDVIVTDRQSIAERLIYYLQEDFNRLIFYSGLLVFLALLIAYGRLELALISFLPMALTWVWILGIMGLLGLKFNVVNIIISTLIFGLGDDYSIFMMDSLMHKYRFGKNKIKSARAAVYLSVLTTIIGLGVLIFANHPALKSIALISVIGLTCVVIISQIVQPFLFNFFIQNRADKGFMPFTLWSFTKSLFSFTNFFIGCIIVTIVGIIFIGLKPLGKKRSKYIFHFILSRYTKSIMYIMSNVTKKVIIKDKKVFERPGVYVVNHSSFLDILLTTMLHPKIVLLTANWVWHSPVFGKIVRMAEYYPVAEGADNSIEHLRNLTDKGYGVLVFPEGTRSIDDSIKRFKKGAFYIARQLKLDIIPIVIHGAHYSMEKGDFLLKDGTITVTVHEAISADDTSYGNNYSERSKNVCKYMRRALQEDKINYETPAYFKEQILKSHIYKGPVLEWYCRVKTGLEKNYELFHRILPREGKFYDLGCGYGFMTFMLHWAAETRQFIGVDYDKEKIETAQNNYFFKQRWNVEKYVNATNIPFCVPLQFQNADLTQYNLQPCNGIIISDVLHYLLPENQKILFEKCMHALETGGVLVIRDGVEDLAHRHKKTKRTEYFSTKLMKFNRTTNELYFIDKKTITDWCKPFNVHLDIIDSGTKLSNLIFVIRKS